MKHPGKSGYPNISVAGYRIRVECVISGENKDILPDWFTEAIQAHYYNRIKIKNRFLDVRRRGSR
ncbi:MAG: hypothetical protein WCC17_17175 [Candidatus Nitrosopolaris sp.]